MSGGDIQAIITAVEALIGLIVQARQNGQLADADLEKYTVNTNQATRDAIAKALASAGLASSSS